MTLTIDLPRSAEARLQEESVRTGVPITELAAQMLMEHMNLDGSTAAKNHVKLTGSVLRYDDPFGPATQVDDWEALGPC